MTRNSCDISGSNEIVLHRPPNISQAALLQHFDDEKQVDEIATDVIL